MSSRNPRSSARRPDAPSALPPAPAGAAQGAARLQAFQVPAVRAGLAAFNRYAAALAGARDLRAVLDAQRAALDDWLACIEALRDPWAELTRAVPPVALAASGWRLKPAAAGGAGAHADAGEPPRDFLEQSRLGWELLMRPWVEAPDLDHTDEFVA